MLLVNFMAKILLLTARVGGSSISIFSRFQPPLPDELKRML